MTITILNTSMIKPRVSDITVVYHLLIMSSFLTQTIMSPLNAGLFLYCCESLLMAKLQKDLS